MNQNFAPLVRFVFAILDLLIMNVIFFILEWYLIKIPLNFHSGEYFYLWIFINCAWMACCWLYTLYQGRFINKFETFFRRTLEIYCLFVVLSLIYLYFSKQLVISRIFVSTFLLSFLFFLIMPIYFILK